VVAIGVAPEATPIEAAPAMPVEHVAEQPAVQLRH